MSFFLNDLIFSVLQQNIFLWKFVLLENIIFLCLKFPQENNKQRK